MRINFLQEAYFKDVTVKREDNRTSAEKLASNARPRIQALVLDFAKKWFLSAYTKKIYSEGHNFYMFQTSQTVDEGLISNYDFKKMLNIDFDNATIYINFYIVGSSYNRKDNEPRLVIINNRDEDFLKMLYQFETSLATKFSQFVIKYNPLVKEYVIAFKDLKQEIGLGFGDVNYFYIKHLFETAETLGIADIKASIYDEDFYKFVKDFENDKRLNHTLNKIVLLYNKDVSEITRFGLVFAEINSKQSAENFEKQVKVSIASNQSTLDAIIRTSKEFPPDRFEDAEALEYEKYTVLDNLKFLKRLVKIDFNKLMKE